MPVSYRETYTQSTSALAATMGFSSRIEETALLEGREALSGLHELTAETVRRNLDRVKADIKVACSKSDRSPDEIEVLVATKYLGIDQFGLLSEAGVRVIGENRAQDLLERRERWGEHFTWDFIGNLQSRKVKLILPEVRLIHSVCTSSVVSQIERCADTTTNVLLAVNVAGEESKPGLMVSDVDRFVESASQCQRMHIVGLMAMPPLTESPESSRRHFLKLRELAQGLSRSWSPKHEFDVLSMGTSQDYRVAIEEGATIVRLGSTLVC